jgi:hypothetical protein
LDQLQMETVGVGQVFLPAELQAEQAELQTLQL